MTRAMHTHETRPGGDVMLHRRVPPQRLMTLVNPVVRAIAGSPVHQMLDSSTLVLHVVGRRSAHHYDIPVNYVDVGGELYVTTQHDWRRNLRDGVDLQITLGGHRRPMHAEVEEEPEAVARTLKAIIDRLGWRIARRRLGLHPAGHATPTVADLQRMVEDADLAVITLTSDDTWRDGLVEHHWSSAAVR